MRRNEKVFDKERRVHEVFEKISENYDEMNAVISFKQHIKWRNDTMKKMNVQKGNACLDLCCGTADWTIAMANIAGKDAKVVGLDFSKNMLAVGERKVKELGLDQVTLVHGNAMELPFEDNTFDYVTIGFGLRNVNNYLTVLKEMNRVLKPGGMVICLETSQPTLPVYKHLFWFYFKRIMPAFGKLFAKSYDEYAWLNESADTFPGAKELKELFERSGFQKVSYKQYSGGAAASHFGYKKTN